MEKTFLWGALCVAISALVGWIVGRFKPARSSRDVGPGDSPGIAGDLQQAADEAGQLSDDLAESAADSGELTEDLGEAADLLGDVIEGLEGSPGDTDRADELLSELLSRHGKTGTKTTAEE